MRGRQGPVEDSWKDGCLSVGSLGVCCNFNQYPCLYLLFQSLLILSMQPIIARIIGLNH